MTRGPVFVDGESVGRRGGASPRVAAGTSAASGGGAAQKPSSEFDVFEYLNDERSDLLRDPVLQRMTVIRYDGDVDEQGFFHGKGTLVSTFGYTYTGDLDRGLMHGSGRIQWANGTTYAGGFHNNIPNGSGAYTWPNGDTYKGEVANAVRHGKGVFLYSALGATYDGHWFEGTRHGAGELRYNAASFYKGEWVKDQKEGKGLMVYDSSDRYEGEWKADKRHGFGTMVWTANGNILELYKGHWVEGLQHGEGFSMYIRLPATLPPNTFVPQTAPGALGDVVPPRDSAVNTYEGNHKKGLRHGFGVFIYDDGSKYEGMWREHRKHGEGKSTSNSGVVTIDTYENGSVATAAGVTGVATAVAAADASDDATLSVEANGVPLYIRDVLGASENNVPEAILSVQSILLRHNGLLRRIFALYGNKSDSVGVLTTPSTWRRDRTHGSMALIQLFRCLSDARLLNGALTIAQVDRMLAQLVDRNTPTNSADATAPPAPSKGGKEATKGLSMLNKLATPWANYKKQLHTFVGELTFRDFTEVVVRIAAFVYEDGAFGTLAQRVLIVVEDHLACLLLPTGAPSFPICPSTRANKEHIAGHTTLLQDLFLFYSVGTSLGCDNSAQSAAVAVRQSAPAGVPTTIAGVTIRARQCLLMLKETKCFDQGRMTVAKALHALFPYDRHPNFTASVHKKRLLPGTVQPPQPAPPSVPRGNVSDCPSTHESEAPSNNATQQQSGGMAESVYRGRWLLHQRSKGLQQRNLHMSLQPELELTFVEFVEAVVNAALLQDTAHAPSERISNFVKSFLIPLHQEHC